MSVAPSPLAVLGMRVVTTVYRRLAVVVHDLQETSGPPAAKIRVELLRESDLGAYAALRSPGEAQAAAARLAYGQRCFVAWRGDEIVHARWIATGRAHVAYLRRDVQLGPAEAYVFQAYTRLSERRQHVAAAVGRRIVSALRAEGVSRMFAVVAVENRGAAAALRAGGWRPIGLWGCLRLGPFQYDFERAFGEEPLPRLVRPAHSSLPQSSPS